jgi:hypothetical protein
MKKLLVSASAIALFAAPALAQNVSTVDQTGSGATATVTQTGNGNNSDVNQASDNSNTEVTQSGGPNTATVNQNAAADNAKALVQQISSPVGGAANTSTITQNANTSAFSNQIGNNNQSTITQDGQSLAPQELPFAYAAFVEQIGANNIASISQPGEENTAASRQYGNNGQSYITQSGLAGTPYVNNVARVTQESGSDNAYSLVSQDGQDNTADVLQYGADNESRITQTGPNHVADVKQYSSGNDSTVTQGGIGNTVTVTQN